MTDHDPLLRPAEAAEILGASIKTVGRWADAGLLPCVRTAGSHRRFPASGVPPPGGPAGGVVVTASTTYPPPRHLKVSARGFEGDFDPGSMVRATIMLRMVPGNAAAYFSVTGEVSTAAQHTQGTYQSCGQLDTLLAEAFPELAPFIPLHLADPHGVPMHAVANAHYWAGLSSWQERDTAALARHLRISAAEAAAIGSTEEAVVEAVEGLRPRWKAEADAAIEFMRAGS